MNNNWPKVRLGDVLQRSDEVVELRPDAEYRGITVKLWGKGVVLRGVVAGAEVASPRRLVAHRGQFILSRIDSRNGALGIVPDELDGAIVSGDFPVFNLATDLLLPSYLGWMCKTDGFVEECRRASEGTTNRVRLQENKFLTMEIPLPPLAEQRRIVARIEEVSDQVNKARALRQDSSKETDSLMVAQLRAIAELLARRHGMTRLESLITEAGYGSSEKCSPERDDGAVPVLRIPNVASERIELDDLKFALLSSREEGSLLLAKGDVLVVRTNGSLELVGRSAVVDELPEPMAFASYMIRLRFNTAVVLPVYAQQMLRHLRVSGQLIDFARTTAGQYNVSLGRLRSAEIPVPPLPEQRQIAAELRTLQAEVDVLKSMQAKTAVELDALMPSILDKAFRGEI